MIVAEVIIKSDIGNILLAKPDYKKTRQFPGGVVENTESPQEATVREAKEELHMRPTIQGGENIDYKFYKPKDVQPLLSSYYSSFWHTYYL